MFFSVNVVLTENKQISSVTLIWCCVFLIIKERLWVLLFESLDDDVSEGPDQVAVLVPFCHCSLSIVSVVGLLAQPLNLLHNGHFRVHELTSLPCHVLNGVRVLMFQVSILIEGVESTCDNTQ